MGIFRLLCQKPLTVGTAEYYETESSRLRKGRGLLEQAVESNLQLQKYPVSTHRDHRLKPPAWPYFFCVIGVSFSRR